MYKEEGYQVMGAAFEVYNQLGYGMAEEIYQQSLEIEFAGPGSTVAIVGAGPIGLAALLTSQFYSPAQIIVIDLEGRGDGEHATDKGVRAEHNGERYHRSARKRQRYDAQHDGDNPAQRHRPPLLSQYV